MVDVRKLSDQLNDRGQHIIGHETALKSAVLVPLFYKEGEWHILFEVRSHVLKRQPGEICFPGGRVEEQDENNAQTALRETCEELQISKDQVQLLGPLDMLIQSQYSFVYPFVGVIAEGAKITPNSEVEEVFTVPLSWLIHHEPELHHLEFQVKSDQDFPFDLIPNGKQYNWRRNKVPEYFYIYNERIIWGLTARILRHFLQVSRLKEASH